MGASSSGKRGVGRFYERQEFERADTNKVTIGREFHLEHLYVEDGVPATRSTRTSDSRKLYVGLDDAIPGTRAAFDVLHTDPSRKN